MENTITIQNVNKLPVPTWRWLKLNDSTISCENIGNFVDIKPQILNLSDEIQLDNHLPLNFPQINTGMGANANDFVKAHALAQKTIIIQENAKITEPISFIYTLNDGDTFIHDDYIHAKKNSEATLIFVYNAPYKSQGFHASSLKIFAEENTKINVIQLQTLGKDFTNFDDVGICSDDTAKISIKQIALGSEKNWLGVNADLIQNNTKVKLNLDYILKQNQNVDINYVANIYGKKNDIEITANGILMHNAKKIMRGTLDFKQGCKGSVGNESENVLLLDEDIQNKSIPLILCSEDDIEGNHSASIGEMDEAQLFYLHTRGLNEEQIRQMQINSKIQLLCNDLPDKLHQYILNYQKEAF